MSPFAVAVLALSMSVDAFAVCVGRGASVTRPRLSEALRTGLVFGFVEALTPVIGWCAGLAASRYVEAVDHWIAFVLLGGVGLHMIHSAFAAQEAEDVSPQRRGALVLIATALGTSIDAMAVGVSLAFAQANIAVVALAIGLATFVMATGGMMVGRLVGAKLGRVAAFAAGIALCGFGVMILHQHLSA